MDKVDTHPSDEKIVSAVREIGGAILPENMFLMNPDRLRRAMALLVDPAHKQDAERLRVLKKKCLVSDAYIRIADGIIGASARANGDGNEG